MKYKLKRESLNKIVYSIILFFWIFNPPVSRYISFTMLFLGISVMYVLFNIDQFWQVCRSYYVNRWLSAYAVFLLYYLFISALWCIENPEYLMDEIRRYISTVGSLLILFIISATITIYLAKRKMDYSDLIDLIINAGMTQAIIGVASFLSPPVKRIFNTLMIHNSRSEKVVSIIKNAPFRNYGYASMLYDGFGLAMALIAIFALSRVLQGRKRYIIAFAMISFAGLINARSSFYLVIAGSAAMMFYIRKFEKRSIIIRKIILIQFMVVLGIFLILYMIRSGSENAVWFTKGIESIVGALQGKENNEGYMAGLSNMTFLPDSTRVFFFGTGLPTDILIGVVSDVGYVQNIFMYGIIGSALLYFTLLYALTKWKKMCKEEEKAIAMGIGIILALFLVKLNILGYGIGSVTYLPVLTFCLSGYSVKSKETFSSVQPAAMRKEIYHDSSNECAKTI